jgi:hypothetical protein
MFQVSSLRRKEGGRYGANRPERHRPAVIWAYYEAPSQLCGLVPDVTPALAEISGLIGALPKTARHFAGHTNESAASLWLRHSQPAIWWLPHPAAGLPLRSIGCVGLSIDDRLVSRPVVVLRALYREFAVIAAHDDEAERSCFLTFTVHRQWASIAGHGRPSPAD